MHSHVVQVRRPKDSTSLTDTPFESVTKPRKKTGMPIGKVPITDELHVHFHPVSVGDGIPVFTCAVRYYIVTKSAGHNWRDFQALSWQSSPCFVC